jgi:hypothetical protein
MCDMRKREVAYFPEEPDLSGGQAGQILTIIVQI